MESSMGRADDLLETPANVSATFLEPGKTILNLYEIDQIILNQLGEDISKQFQDFQMRNAKPENLDILITFFKGRTDLLSESCYEALSDLL